MSNPQDFPELDYDFMRYMGVKSETQRKIHSHYLPYFEGRTKVLDLACGDADFVAILHEQGIDVTGVDSETRAVEKAQTAGLKVIESDVFDYLSECNDESYDAIFCAHLVEHLPYPLVIKLVQESYRVLEPGGLIILATPNAKALYSHLEMFYMHYDHVNFYHPKLLTFFLEHEQFVDAKSDTNPYTASPMMAELHHLQTPHLAVSPSPDELLKDLRRYYEHDPSESIGGLRKFVRAVKDSVAYLFVRPYVDKLAHATYLALHQMQQAQYAHQAATTHDFGQVYTALASLNEPFECYAMAYKPGIQSPVFSKP